MITEHLNDEILQRIALGEDISELMSTHLGACPVCMAKAMQYRALISGLQARPVLAFDFDIEALVPDAVRPRRQFPWLGLLIGLLLVAGLAIVVVGLASLQLATAGPLFIGIAIMVLAIGTIFLFLQHYRSWRLLSIS